MNVFTICGFSQTEILMLQAIIGGALIAPLTPRLVEMYKKFKIRKKKKEKVRRY